MVLSREEEEEEAGEVEQTLFEFREIFLLLFRLTTGGGLQTPNRRVFCVTYTTSLVTSSLVFTLNLN